jgi:queuine tRNA-ribosyltransferase
MPARPFAFTVTHRNGQARRGRLETAHGPVETPAFMPVGTRGAVRGVTQRDLRDAGAAILLANTYHLHLRPGDDLIAERGGLHRFIGWPGPLLTDSGGYQVFSLGPLVTITDEGARFRSHIDGSLHHLTPEKVVDIQAQLGSDIAMVLDECLAAPASEDQSAASLALTLRWARRARDRFLAVRDGGVPGVVVTNPGQAQFGIIQGGTFPRLRAESVAATTAIGFEAYAIGGLSVGEPVDVMYDVVGFTAPLLPDDRPRYLMGTGMPDDLVECVARGIDMFDCVLPTRNGRNGQVFTEDGPMNLRNARFARDDRPIADGCRCYTCRQHSRAYLRHLFQAQEMNAGTLASLHNLVFYLDTLERIRQAIGFGVFEAFRQDFHRRYSRTPPAA